MPRRNQEIKNGVVDAKCKLSKEECTDPACLVHGEPEEVAEPEGAALEPDPKRPPTLEEVMKAGYGEEAAQQIVAKEQAAFDAGQKPYGEAERTEEPANPGAEKMAAVEAEAQAVAKSAIEVPISSVPELNSKDDEVRSALRDAQELIKHLNHPNEFTTGLVERIEKILNPPVELFTMEEARKRLGV